MNKKIYLNTYEDDSRLKKIRIDEGVYTIGNKKKEVDIFVDDDSLENSLRVVVKSDKTVFLKIGKQNKTLLINNNKITTEDKKFEIKHNDHITFKKSNKSLKFRFQEIKRERSRSKDLLPKIETEHKQEIPKEVANNTNKAYIKSEVIWNSVSFDDEKRKEKFLKLMGAKKKNQFESSSSTLEKHESEKIQDTFQKIERDLTKQYYSAIGRK
jgi:hypothetical protein